MTTRTHAGLFAGRFRTRKIPFASLTFATLMAIWVHAAPVAAVPFVQSQSDVELESDGIPEAPDASASSDRGGPASQPELFPDEASDETWAVDDAAWDQLEDDLSGESHVELAAHRRELSGCYDAPLGEKSQPGLAQWMADRHRASGACWTGRVETLLLWRNAPRGRPIISTLSPPASVGPAVIDAGSLESSLAAGPRFSLFRTDTCGRAIEFTYLRAFNFHAEQTTPPSVAGYTLLPDGIFGNTFPPPNPGLDGASANLGAGIQGFEVNRRLPWTQNISLLGGLRWVEWRESFDLLTSITEPSLGRIDDFYSMNTINSLYGLQIGADGRLFTPARWLRFDGLVKAGYYYNIAVQNSSVSLGGVPPFSESLRVGTNPALPAFVGEVGLTGTIPLTSWLDFQFGYLGLWLEGIAQPTNLLSSQSLTQISPPPPSGSISATGGTVVQGVTFGLQGRW